MRLIFGQKRSTIDVRDIMDTGKILLVNLAKGKLTEANSRFLGMVLMAKIQVAAMERVDRPALERRPFYLYVDEFQSLANQFLSQIKDDRIIEAVFGNVGTLICFRVGHADAELLAPQFLPFLDATDLTNLSNWTAAVKTTVQGETATPFTLHTVAAKGRSDLETAAAVRALSRSQYGRPRAEVEREMESGLAGRDGETGAGR